MTVTWDILITSIPHRHDKLTGLLKVLDAQLWGIGGFIDNVHSYGKGVGVILYRDDLETPYGDKTRALVEASAADYVSCLDDDDSVAPDFVRKVTAALHSEPDYVGFRVKWTCNGGSCMPVTHSLAFPEWKDTAWELQRDIAQFNPIRRSFAMPEAWGGAWRADRHWSDAVRASHLLNKQEFIDDEMYYYQQNTSDTFQSPRVPAGEMPELPDYPWLRQIGPYA